VSQWQLFLFARTSSVRSLSNSKFQILTLRNVARVVLETVHEFPLHCGLWPILFALLAQLLELKSLEVHLLKTLHARVVLNDTLEGAFRDLGESSKRLHLEVASIDELINVFLVDFLELLFKCPVVLRHLEESACGSVLLFILRLRRLFLPLLLRRRPFVSKVVYSGGPLRFVNVYSYYILVLSIPARWARWVGVTHS